MYSTEDIFSPLDGDVSLQTRFSDGSGLISPTLSPTYKQYEASSNSPVSGAKRHSIPRKPLPGYTQINAHQHTDSFSAMSTITSIEEEKKDAQIITEKEIVKRGWRFYGTFACLALLNLICAIDATILSVALPVRHAHSRFNVMLMKCKDNSHESAVNSH
jgi:hypothetical protein